MWKRDSHGQRNKGETLSHFFHQSPISTGFDFPVLCPNSSRLISLTFDWLAVHSAPVVIGHKMVYDLN